MNDEAAPESGKNVAVATAAFLVGVAVGTLRLLLTWAGQSDLPWLRDTNTLGTRQPLVAMVTRRGR